MKGYVFISNSSKPSPEKAASRAPIALSNVSMPCIKAALEMGYKVFYGTNREHPEELSCNFPVTMFHAHTYRSITAFKDNYIAFKNLSKVFKENDIEVIHCNTPVGGLIGRLCAKKYHAKRVIYTAHGFHFYKGAPLINRTIYKWAEQIMAHWTDAIITMNREDYEAASKFRMRKGGKVFFVHGVGIDTDRYMPNESVRIKKREELGLTEKDVMLVSAGDLIKRKNYRSAIRAISLCKNENVHYFICGRGPDENELREYIASLGVEKNVHLLGFRTDMKELLSAADVFLLSSLQEGLPRSTMEAMASGLPCIVSAIRGNTDLIDDGVEGYLCDPNDAEGFAARINTLAADPGLRDRMKNACLEKIQQYDIQVVVKEIADIYHTVLNY